MEEGRPISESIAGRISRKGFYYDLWNAANEAVAWEILHPDFRFRASLGPEKIGPAGFIEYMRLIHAALVGFQCTIQFKRCWRAANAWQPDCVSVESIAVYSSGYRPPAERLCGRAQPSFT
jgi:hypothetical protein